MKFVITSVAGANDSKARIGDTVYECKYYDYGLASDDSRHQGVEHVSVTFREDGGYPFFTIPKQNLLQQ